MKKIDDINIVIWAIGITLILIFIVQIFTAK